MRKDIKRILAAALTGVLAVTMLGTAGYGEPYAGEWQPPAPPEVAGLKVRELAGGTELVVGSRDRVKKTPEAVSWPAAAGARVSLTAAAGAESRVAAEGMPVRVGAPDKSKTAPGAVRLQVAGRKATDAAGVKGVLLTVARDDAASAGESAVTVEVDYTKFAAAYGGDWASRLGLVKLDGCRVEGEKVSGTCRMRPLESANSTGTKKISATVPLDGAAAATLAVMAASSGSNGNYSATSLAPAGSWQVSAQTGGFSWSLPLRMVPGVNGPVPSLSMGYSSQAVDGRTGNTNTQGSWIGDGWDMWPGYVERSYQSCAADKDPVNGQPSNNPDGTGDQCWFSDNATMSLNGRNTSLIKAADGKWKGVSDDGSRIERLNNTGLGNGDNDGEYWKVTTTDGTQYFFGRNRRDGFPADTASTGSTWVVPVYGNPPRRTRLRGR